VETSGGLNLEVPMMALGKTLNNIFNVIMVWNCGCSCFFEVIYIWKCIKIIYFFIF
jgi:hypothetical protein